MNAWHTYPTHLRLGNGSYVPVVLMFQPATGDLVGATVVQDPADAAALLARLVDAHGCPETLRSIWDPLFEDLNAAARKAVRQAGCPKPASRLDRDDFIWALDIGNAATQAIRASNPATIDDVATALKTWLHAPVPTRAATVAGQRSGSLTVDAHPCEGPGSDPQDLLPDDRAWGSRTPQPDAP